MGIPFWSFMNINNIVQSTMLNFVRLIIHRHDNIYIVYIKL